MEFMHSPLSSPETILHEKEAVFDAQWSRLAEAARREMARNPLVKEFLATLADKPVAEDLPLRFIEAASQQSDLIARVAESSAELLSFLRSPTHPELANSNLKWMAKYKPKEVMEVSRRLRFARDLKILAVGSILSLEPDQQKALGVTVELTEHAAEYPLLLRPDEWSSRAEIHDRVYVAQVGDEKLILKEQKSRQHMRQNRHAIEIANTSAEEVRIAKELREQTTYEGSDILLSYEIPIAAVTQADGYQFALFKFEEGLLERDEAMAQIAHNILENFEGYEADYQMALGLIQEYLSEYGKPRLLRKVILSLGKEVLPAWKRFLGTQPREITEKQTRSQDLEITLGKDQFATILADILIQEGNRHLEAVVEKLGYKPEDGNQKMYRPHLSANKRAQLEVVAFDFEFHRKVGKRDDPYDDQAYEMTRQRFNQPRLPNRDYAADPEDIPKQVAFYAVKEARRLSLGKQQPIS